MLIQIVTVLKEEGKLNEKEYQGVIDYVKNNQTEPEDYGNNKIVNILQKLSRAFTEIYLRKGIYFFMAK